MLRFLAIFGLLIYVFRTFFKLFGSFNLNGTTQRKQAESGENNINVDFAPKQESNLDVSGDYVDFEEVVE